MISSRGTPRPAPGTMADLTSERDAGCLVAARCANGLALSPVPEANTPSSLRPSGSMALMAALADHLRSRTRDEDCDLHQAGLAQEFTDAWQRDPDRGFGDGEVRIFLAIVNGVSWRNATASAFGGTGSFGAAAAARVAPVGLLPAPLNRLDQLARDSAYVTHAHPLALDGAAIQACAVAYARRASPDQPLAVFHLVSTVARYATTPDFRAQLVRLAALVRDRFSHQDAIRALGGDDGAVTAVPLALAAFLHSPDDLPKIVRFALPLDHGTGHIAAMAGALAGARNGADAIPRSWSRRLADTEHR
ncbi:poly(ADP-ribose) glycohydrolase ARH3 [Nocardiopsis sp. Huas11]|uniref:ADP-ribosylglycohydrolase family protein n=1 Tax=Nocardiopsis sp. Huas11 TaxID=2183912 RepID=UPI000EAD22F4|nr:ADP-ribosylglycohydrolase family protein [Nocardiopsis sp. Huas11]RKS08390.1 poly(ADP-ribose) glycohydrolase ARH3 [Nocardiopsis sp. Huas11]